MPPWGDALCVGKGPDVLAKVPVLLIAVSIVPSTKRTRTIRRTKQAGGGRTFPQSHP